MSNLRCYLAEAHAQVHSDDKQHLVVLFNILKLTLLIFFHYFFFCLLDAADYVLHCLVVVIGDHQSLLDEMLLKAHLPQLPLHRLGCLSSNLGLFGLRFLLGLFG